MSPLKQIDGKIEAEGELYLHDSFWKNLNEIYSESLEKTVQPLIEAAQEPERLDWYDIRDYDLSEERKDFRINDFPGEGDIVFVISITGSASIKFDSPNADPFDLSLDGFKKIKHRYSELYLTNEAQEGETLKILFGRGDWDFVEKIPEMDIQGTVRNDYLNQITDPLKIGQIIKDGHIVPHADIACEKILITGTTRLDQWRSTEDYTFIAPGKILLHATTKLSDWQHPANTTYIHGGQIYTESILTAALAALSVTTEKLAVGAATAEKINVDQLSAIAADVGILTAGIIKSTDAKTLFDLTNGFMSVSDGVYIRFKAGKLNGDYGTEIRDAAGKLTVDEGKIVGGVDYKYVSADNSISTTSAAYTDMANMSITVTLPKCIALLLSVTWLDTATGGASECRIAFYIDGEYKGYFTGAESGKKIVVANMHVESLAAGSHTFKLRWRTDAAGNTSYSHERRLAVLYWYVT